MLFYMKELGQKIYALIELWLFVEIDIQLQFRVWLINVIRQITKKITNHDKKFKFLKKLRAF